MEIRIGAGPPPVRPRLGWPWLLPPLTLAAALLISAVSALPW